MSPTAAAVRKLLVGIVPAICGSTSSLAAEVSDGLEAVTVTATRIETPSFAVPASIDVLDGKRFNVDTLGVNLSEGLGSVAGLLARDRQNYAQDTQISIRGFGARSTFGIRGVRLYADGIPATQPDGQGQISHFNLASAARVEVLRGPFSALYGNSSGGVIQIFSVDGQTPATLSAGVAGGSFGTYRASVGANGKHGDADYNVAYSEFYTDGFRDHSEARRRSLNGKLNLQLSDDDRLSLVLNSFSSPDVQDPLGLTASQVASDASMGTPEATQFNTRKSVDQTQGGAIYTRTLTTTQSLKAVAYTGRRSIEQYLAIPSAPQANARHSGGVVDLSSDFGGGEMQWSYDGQVAGKEVTAVAGLNYDQLRQHRRGYENFIGSTLGVRGALRRDEINTATSFDQYLQTSVQFTARWSALAGVRHSRIEFESADRYIVTGNPNDSGRTQHSATLPVAGILLRATPQLNVYATYGRGFETPTFAELAYQPNGSAGLNFALNAASSRNTEVGAKLKVGEHAHASAAVFYVGTRDELVVATNSGGRSTYANAGRTQRQGAELQFSNRFAERWHVEMAYTYLDATVRDRYVTCTAAPCTVPATVVNAGNALPAVPRSSAYAALSWGAEAGWHAGIDVRYLSRIQVNDVNSESAPSYALVGVDGGYVFATRSALVRTFINVENALDRNYIGSVIVNDGNGRYYEPGTSLSVLAGVSVKWRY